MNPAHNRKKKVSVPFSLTMSLDVLNELKKIKNIKNESYLTLLKKILVEQYPYFVDPTSQEKVIYITTKTGKKGSTSINLEPDFYNQLIELSKILSVSLGKLIENAVIERLLK